jgi:hypothetical protein
MFGKALNELDDTLIGMAFGSNPRFKSFACWLVWWLKQKGGEARFSVPHLLRQSHQWKYGRFHWSEKGKIVFRRYDRPSRTHEVDRRTVYRYVLKLMELGLIERRASLRAPKEPWFYDDCGLKEYFDGRS